MNIATALLEHIKKRGLDELFSTEEAASKQVCTWCLVLLFPALIMGTDCREHPGDSPRLTSRWEFHLNR